MLQLTRAVFGTTSMAIMEIPVKRNCRPDLRVIREELGFETHRFLPLPVLSKKTHLWRPAGLETPFLQQRALSLLATRPVPSPLQPAALPSAPRPPPPGPGRALSSGCPPSLSRSPLLLAPTLLWDRLNHPLHGDPLSSLQQEEVSSG